MTEVTIVGSYRIRTSFVNPPIPIRSFDWAAFLDGEEESGRYGYGTTESDAVSELLGMIEESEVAS